MDTLATTTNAAPIGIGEDPFAVIFAPAKPVLDARIEIRKPLAWLSEKRRSGGPLFDPNRAADLINTIPSGNRIAKVGALFIEAEKKRHQRRALGSCWTLSPAPWG